MIGPCNNTNNSDPMIVNYKDDKVNKILTITIDTSTVYNATKVCLKFYRDSWPGTMMSEPFYLQVFDPCP